MTISSSIDLMDNVSPRRTRRSATIDCQSPRERPIQRPRTRRTRSLSPGSKSEISPILHPVNGDTAALVKALGSASWERQLRPSQSWDKQAQEALAMRSLNHIGRQRSRSLMSRDKGPKTSSLSGLVIYGVCCSPESEDG